LDYLTYAYLQKNETKLAKQQCDYLDTFKAAYPVNFKVAYAFAAMPARYVLENKLWKEAASLKQNTTLPWQKFPWENAITHFARLLGFVHINQPDSARNELQILNTLRDTLLAQKDAYKANQVDIQIKAAQGWIFWKEGKSKEALEYMKLAADMEDKTEKHPVTPAEVLPARELLGDMLLLMQKPGEALLAYEDDLQKHPNRFNGLYGAATAAEKSGKTELSKNYLKQLSLITGKNITLNFREAEDKKLLTKGN